MDATAQQERENLKNVKQKVTVVDDRISSIVAKIDVQRHALQKTEKELSELENSSSKVS